MPNRDPHRTSAARESAFNHPFDTPLSSGLRFAAELIGWVAGTWAVAQWSVWLAVPTLIVLVGLPSVFSTPGDKKQVVVATPGPLRVVLELFLYAVAVAGAWLVWPTWLAGIATAIVVASLVVGMPRTMWLLRGAPRPG
jgi:hypothetical protein